MKTIYYFLGSFVGIRRPNSYHLAKSLSIVETFTKTINDLKENNSELHKAKIRNNNKMAKIQLENDAMNASQTANTKAIEKLSEIFG